MGMFDMLCVPPWGETILPNSVPQCPQADPQHLGGMRTVAVGESQRVFQVQPLQRANRRAGTRACDWASRLHLVHNVGPGGRLKLHLEAVGVDVLCVAQREDPAYEVR